jgi:hypothetical protein
MFFPLGPLAAFPIEQPANTQAANDARYRWMRAAWLEGVEDGTDPVAQQAIGMCQTEDEIDAVIDAQIAAGNWPVRP